MNEDRASPRAELLSRMKIVRIEGIPFSIPFCRPLSFANGTVASADHVLVRIWTDVGVTGEAEVVPRAMTYGDSQASTMHALQAWFEPTLVGLDPFAVERVTEVLNRVAGNHPVKAAIDLALHDVIGKVTGQPCFRLLGGYTDRLLVSYMLGLGSPAEVAEEAVAKAEAYGIRAFKIKVGVDPKLDVAICRAVRDALGDGVLLYVDANHGYRAEDAIEALRAMADCGVAWAEEPSPASDPIGRRLVSRSVPLPIGADESATTLADAARELQSGAIRIISVKPARTGFTTSRYIVGLATALGARSVCGSQIESSVGVLASLAFGAACAATASTPAELATWMELEDDLLQEPLQIRDGTMHCPFRPGLGIAVDEEKLAHYRLDKDRRRSTMPLQIGVDPL